VREAIGKSKPLEYRFGPPFRLGRVHASDAQGHLRVFQRREFWKEMMELKNEPDALVPKRRQRVVRHGAKVGISDSDRARIAAIEAAKQM
jgi:phosphoketolase